MIKKQTKILFIAFLLLDIIIIAIFVTLFSHMNNQISEMVSTTEEIRTVIRKHETLSVMKTDIQSAKTYQTTLKKFFVQKDDEVGFIKVLENLVASSSLKLQVNSVSNESSNQASSINAELIRVNINVTGEWKNIQFFLQLLEIYPLKISIDKISLAKFADYEVRGRKISQWSGTFDFTVIKLKN